MRLRGDYLLLVGAPDRRRAQSFAVVDRFCANGLSQRIEGEDFTLLHSPDVPVGRLGHASLVLGNILPRDPVRSLERLGQAACASGGRLLIDEFWGDYVALLADPGSGAVRAVRSPSGGLHAYRARAHGLDYLASRADLLVGCGAASVATDWTFVAHHLRFPHLVGARTGLEDIDEIIPGNIAGVGSVDRTSRTLWSPWTFTDQSRQFATAEDARTAVRDTIVAAVEALAKPYGSILLELSGGLDSSIVAAALTSKAIAARAVNLVTATGEGDERAFAKATADRTGLILSEERLGNVDLTAPCHARLARPGVPAILREADTVLMRHAVKHRADAFASGSGGDSVFCSLGSAAPAADALIRFGCGRRFVDAVAAVAKIHAVSVWQVGRMAIRQARRGALHSGWTPAETFLTGEATPVGPNHHPWLDEPTDLLPGSRSHVRSIMSTLAHLDGYRRQLVAPSIYPLLSQPVIETCLRVPSWMWVEHGRDRSVAREAFRAMLPAMTIERRSKGRIDAYCLRSLATNLDRVRPYLLDGLLMRGGLIDRPALEAALRLDGGSDGSIVYRILPLIDVESWLRSWSE